MRQQDALDILKLGNNAFITGMAGSGKTHLLNQYIDYLQRNKVGIAVTASTGIAATHLGGQTIHSWSGLGIKDSFNKHDIEVLSEKSYLRKRYANTKVLIIDEISMLHHFRLDLVDKIAREMKGADIPFGGMQVILCGDFFQLPPVSRGDEPEARFAYDSHVWEDLNLQICYLEEQYRQDDQGYLTILNSIRDNAVTDEIFAKLQSRITSNPAAENGGTKLYTHNLNVDAENERELAKLSGDTVEYHMEWRGKDNLAMALIKGCLAPEKLRLKQNAKVMFVKNNFDEHYANGTIATVVSCDEDSIVVKDKTGRIINVNPTSWEISENGKVLAEITQYPLRLAWAITVHKSQGMSLDRAEIDLSRSFEKGMGYVALSRLKSLEGLTLRGINQMAMAVDEFVLEKDEEFRNQSFLNTQSLNKLSDKDMREIQQKFIKGISDSDSTPKKPDTISETKRLLEAGKNLKEISIERGLKTGTIIDHIEKLKENDSKLNLINIAKEIEPNRLEKITSALQKSDKGKGEFHLAPARSLLGNSYSYDEIRLARLLIDINS
jgi:ATP-dependent DNA helicase PIF1